VPVTGGLAAGGLRYAADIGAETIQVFVSNPRGWALSAGDARQDAALADHVAGTGLRVFVHAPYHQGVPFITETPGPRAAVTADVATLKALRGKGRLPGPRAAAMR
jgi:deoxyribonuclease IV